METKDFDDTFFKVFFNSLNDDNTLILELFINDQKYLKTCTLFRIPGNQNFIYKNQLTDFIKDSIIKDSEYRIKFLKDRRKKLDDNINLIMLYSKDLKINYNDLILKYIKDLVEKQQFNTTILNIRKKE